MSRDRTLFRISEVCDRQVLETAESRLEQFDTIKEPSFRFGAAFSKGKFQVSPGVATARGRLCGTRAHGQSGGLEDDLSRAAETCPGLQPRKSRSRRPGKRRFLSFVSNSLGLIS